MNYEHVAFMTPDPIASAAWYVQHLGFRVAKANTTSPFAHFLITPGASVMIEIYNNPSVAMPDYRKIDPLQFHLAFAVDDMDATHKKLTAAGATTELAPHTTAAGDQFAMLRDPWGVPVQLVKRKIKMV